MSITNNDARIVLGMILRGDKQHDIAAWFGENQARIVEIEKGSHGALSAAPSNELPPKGAPGPKGRRLRGWVRKALESLESGNVEQAKAQLKSGTSDYDKHES